MAGGMTESASTSFYYCTVLICTAMLALAYLTRAESYAIPRLTSTSPKEDFNFLADIVFRQRISAPALEQGIFKFSYVLIGLAYFPLHWICKHLEESEYFGSNFH